MMKIGLRGGLFAVGVAVLAGCVAFQDKIGGYIGDDNAELVVDLGCQGATAFVEVATADLPPIVAGLVVSGVNKSCAARSDSDRTRISSTVYQSPLDAFCLNSPELTEADEPDFERRSAFNQALDDTCNGKQSALSSSDRTVFAFIVRGAMKGGAS